MLLDMGWMMAAGVACAVSYALNTRRNVGKGGLVVYPAPAGEKLSEDFELKVEGRTVPVYMCRVSAIPFNRVWPGHQRSLDQTELASFAYWDMAEPVTVEVVSRRPVESVEIRPMGRGIKAKVEGNKITFRMAEAGQITVEVNGLHYALHVFANPAADTEVDAKDPHIHYFGPGIHEAGRIKMESGQTVYLAGGALVYGAIEAAGATNIKVLGRGILDTSKFERGERGEGQPHGNIRFTDCRDVVIDGVILRDPNVWSLTTLTCQNVTISNVKLIGLWRYNADGIDICNSQDVVIRDCFIRSFDDGIVIKGLRRNEGMESKSVRRVLAERCVIWCDWGRAMEIGAETIAPEMTDITFRDCDIIRTNFAAMDIQHGDSAPIKNVLFENIRLEIDDVNTAMVFQESDEQIYKPDYDFVPWLLVIEIVTTMWNHDAERGTVDNVVLRNISVTGKQRPPTRIQGFDAGHMVKGVTIENLRLNGKAINSLEEAGVILRPFVQDVTIK